MVAWLFVFLYRIVRGDDNLGIESQGCDWAVPKPIEEWAYQLCYNNNIYLLSENFIMNNTIVLFDKNSYYNFFIIIYCILL